MKRPSPSLVISFLALFIALSGTSYAVAKLPKKSVGTAQLKNSAVTTKKVKNGSLLASDFKQGQLPAGAKGDTGEKGEKGDRGATGPSTSAGAEVERNPVVNITDTFTLMLSLTQSADRSTGPLTVAEPSRLIVNSQVQLWRQYTGSGLRVATCVIQLSGGGEWEDIGDRMTFQEVGNPTAGAVSHGAFTTFVDVVPGTYDLRLLCVGFTNSFAFSKGSITAVATGR